MLVTMTLIQLFHSPIMNSKAREAKKFVQGQNFSVAKPDPEPGCHVTGFYCAFMFFSVILKST